MIKHFFLFCLIPCALLLPSIELKGQAKAKTTGVAAAAFVTFTVTKVTGSVTLNGRQLKVGDKISENDKSKILVGKNGYYELSDASGGSSLYGAKCANPPCSPSLLVTTVAKGPKKEILVGTQAELDQIMAIFNQDVLVKQQQIQLDKQQLQLEKAKAPQQQKAPQKLNNKAKAGGGR